MSSNYKKFFWQIFPGTILVLILSLTLLTWFTGSAVRSFYYSQSEIELSARAELIKAQVCDLFQKQDLAALNHLVQTIGPAADTRITVIGINGQVLADSQSNPQQMESHANRPEIGQALHNTIGSAIRYSSTLDARLMYVAVPLHIDQQQVSPVAILRLAVPVSDIDAALQAIQLKMLLAALLIIMVSTVLIWRMSHRFSRPLELLKKNADLIARGDFSHDHLSSSSLPLSQEVAGLSQAMDQMSRQLEQQINWIVSQRMQLEAVLSGMVEGVIAVDMEQRILYLNQSAGRLFQVDGKACPGQSLEAVIRHFGLLQFLKKILASSTPLEEELSLHHPNSVFLTVHGVQLLDQDQQQIGALLVLHDITRLKKLEEVRRDFVANVSHELKTPITSIQGFVETLLDGALDDQDHARKFLQIIGRQTSSLSSIVDDLLFLSHIEEEIRQDEVDLNIGTIAQVLAMAAETCRPKADQKGIALLVDCPQDLQGLLNERLLEQAVVNLIVNAVKYSPDNSEIQIRAAIQERRISISVSDSGVGIEAQHLPRLFERFYRSDKARSRKLGGTGLGLAIVKHIMESHHGSVSVSSRPGSGSTFVLTLPLPPEPPVNRSAQ